VLVPAAGAALAVWLGARWRRGERRLPAACLLAVAGAVLTTELLKLVLARRAGVPEQLAEGYPSGHTTGAFATALAYLVAARGRPPTALAAAYVALVAAGVVLDGWHLPSDALGAIFVASAWLFGALALLDPPRTSHRVTAGDAAAALVLTALVVVLLLAHPGVPAHARLVRQSAEAAGGLAAAALVAVLAVYAIAVRSASTTRS
jgi:membrane-associated phospholipid phosphatase